MSVRIPATKTAGFFCGFLQYYLVNAGISPQIKLGQFPFTSCPIRYCQNIQPYGVRATKTSIHKQETEGKCEIRKVTKSIYIISYRINKLRYCF